MNREMTIRNAEVTLTMAEFLPTPEQIHILQHSLGIADGHREYRNYYAVEDFNADCEALCAVGLMVKSHGVPGYDKLMWNMVHYHVTSEGKRVAYDNLPPPKKLTRAQRRYQAWLKASDVIEMSFIEWCRSEYGKLVR